MLNDIINFSSILLSVLDIKLFLVNIADLFEEIRLPAEKLDSLDIVETFIDVEVALLRFAALFLTNLALGLAPDVLDQHSASGKAKAKEATPANLIEDNNGCANENVEAFKIGGAFPDESPDAIRLTHHNMIDVTSAEVFVGCSRHLKVFAEKHHFQGGMSTVANLNHLESKVLPNGVHDDSAKGDKQAKEAHSDSIFNRRLCIRLQPLKHVVNDERQNKLLSSAETANCKELDKFPPIGIEQAFHESESILRVLLDVPLDALLDLGLLMFNKKAFGKLTVLFKFDLLGH